MGHLEHFWTIFASSILSGTTCKPSNYGNNAQSETQPLGEVLIVGFLWNQLGMEIKDDQKMQNASRDSWRLCKRSSSNIWKLLREVYKRSPADKDKKLQRQGRMQNSPGRFPV